MVKNNHSSHRLDVDTRLVTVGTALTAAGSIVALTGLAITASALLGAARKMIRDMETSPGDMAGARLRQAKHASRAGLAAWQEAADGHAARHT
ncbi:MAG: hypothetical protein HOU01_16870 [Streptomycetaceae bacterium]|jgi:hypothetical protein|nr:hypothetical protein [Streptomycetaceae bacterium]